MAASLFTIAIVAISFHCAYLQDFSKPAPQELPANATPITAFTKVKYLPIDTMLVNLDDISRLVSNLQSSQKDNNTSKDILSIYASLGHLNWQTYAANPAETSNIRENLADFLIAISKQSSSDISMISLDVSIVIKNKVVDPKPYPIGNGVYENHHFNIRETSIVGHSKHSAYVIYKENTSPLKPLPTVSNIIQFQVVDLVLTETKKIENRARERLPKGPGSMESNYPFRIIIFNVTLSTIKHNAKHNCAYWDETQNAWTSERCLVFSELPNVVTCHCDTKDALKTTHFIVYTYLEYSKDLIGFIDYTPKDISLNSELNQYMNAISQAAKFSERPAAMDDLMNNLIKVFHYNSSLDVNESGAAFMRDIGEILGKIVPFEETGLLGRGNAFTTAFVVRLDLFQGDPIIGYAFYKNTSIWMEYQKSQVLNRNRLFGNHFAFAFHFSPSVLSQNSRYAFLLYPEDVFFQPPPSLSGKHVVIASRVIDIFLTPKAVANKKEELIYIFYRPSVARIDNGFECAAWDAEAKIWDASSCLTTSKKYYQPECTCNMSKVQTSRTQYIIYEYRMTNCETNDIQREIEIKDLFKMEASAFALSALLPLKTYGEGVNVTLQLLTSALLIDREISISYEPTIVHQLAHDSHEALIGSQILETSFDQYGFNYLQLNLREGKNAFTFKSKKVRYLSGELTEVAKDSDLPDFLLRVSDSVVKHNKVYGFLVYPRDVYPGSLPHLAHGLQIVTFRVVDIVLVEDNSKKTVDDQFVELCHVKGEKISSMVGCASWSEIKQDWTSDGCSTVNGFFPPICQCNLSRNFLESRTGGQYIVYSYFDAEVNENVFLNLGTAQNDTEILGLAEMFLGNSLLVSPTIESVVRDLEVTDRVLSLSPKVLSDNRKSLQNIGNTIETLIGQYYTNENQPVMHSVAIATTSSFKKAELITDLFSTSFLNDGNTINDTVIPSNIFLMAFGFYNNSTSGPTGFYLKPYNETIGYIENGDFRNSLSSKSLAVALTDDQDLLVQRMVFIVYPINKMIYTKENITAKPIFNLRAIEIHLTEKDTLATPQTESPQYPDYNNYRDPMHHHHGHGALNYHAIAAPDEYVMSPTIGVEFFFQPSPNPQNYLRTGCSVWQELTNSWSTGENVCKMARDNVCRCYIGIAAVTKVVLYEYADIVNFSPIKSYDAKGTLFIISSFLSILGITFIVLTALFYPEWRRCFGNKIFLHLAAATMFYLCVTMYRESHFVYYVAGETNLVVLSVFVHYTRLVHYDWMAVVSIQQWKGAAWSGLEKTDSTRLLRIIAIAAWGLPLIPLFVALMWDIQAHFSAPHKVITYVLFIGPGIFITIFNIILLVAITIRMCRFWYLWKKEFGKSGISDRTMMLMQLKSVVQMFFLFGIPTSFEIINSFGTKDEVLDFLFKVIDPLQGFMLFMFFICFDKATRKLWMSCDSASLIRLDLEMPEREVNNRDGTTTTPTYDWLI